MAQIVTNEYLINKSKSNMWTFRDKSTRKYTHAMHLYPARMHPEIARRLIMKYVQNKSDIVLDPFMGSGGVLLEAILHGNNSIGIDLNPFAVLLSKVKTTAIRTNLANTINRVLKRSKEDLFNAEYGKDKYTSCMPSSLYDLEEWFHPDVLRELAIIKYHIYKTRDQNILDFLKICLSLAVRKSSYQRNGAWKIHRISLEDRKNFRPQPFDIFAHIVMDNTNKMYNLINANPSGSAYPIFGDSRDMKSCFTKIEHNNILNDNKVNLIVTSPPYGDHKTTVAYGQFSRHLGHWLDLPEEQVLQVDNNGLGGKKYNDMDDLGSHTLNKTLDKIHKNDIILTNGKVPCRSRDVYAFFLDLDKCLYQIYDNMDSKKKSYACFVVANRTVRRVVVPTDVILAELGVKHGFKIKDVIYREIPNKSMPSKNAPENITNETGNTMTKETIITMSC